jgi:hypothetical protein
LPKVIIDESKTANGIATGIKDRNENVKNLNKTHALIPLPTISSIYVNICIKKNANTPIKRVRKKGGKYAFSK